MSTTHPPYTALFLTLLVCSVHADCPLSFYPRHTTIGYIRADIDASPPTQNQPQTYEYPLVDQLKGSLPTRTVVGVTGLSLDKKSQQFGYKIQVTTPRSTTSTVVFKVSVVKGQNNDRWRYISFTFIVSQAPELLLGTKNVLQFIPTSDPSALRVMQLVSLPSSSFNYRAVAKIFVSGIEIKEKSSLSAESVMKIDESIKQIKKLSQYSWNIKLINRFIKILSNNKMPSFSLSEPNFSQSGLLSFEIRTSQMQLKAFTFSYLVYLQKGNSDILYQTISGSFSLSDEDTYNYSELENDGMKIIGLTGFTYSSDNNGVISLEIQYGKNNNLNFFGGRIEGLYTQFTLSFFGISTLPGAVCRTCPGSPLIYEEFCISECPVGFVSSINSDGSFYCHQCSVQNFLIARDDKQSCVCASGHYLISPTQQCEKCPYDCLTCNGNICLTCDTLIPSTYRILNSKTGRCQCQIANSKGLSLYDDIHGQYAKCVACNARCKTCLGPKISDCLSCPPYRTLSSGVCKCEQNFMEDGNDQCVCLAPYALLRGKCVLYQNKCKENQKLTLLPSGGKVCTCVDGYTRSFVSNICLKQCRAYEQFNYETEECECRQGCARNERTKICFECSSKLNQIYNEYSKQCECMDGYEMNRVGDCIQCPPKTYYNENSDTCDCIFNYYKSGNICVKCRNQRDGPSCKRLATMPGLEL